MAKKKVEEKVEEKSDEIVEEVIINDPLEVKEEVHESNIKQAPHVKLEYSVSDDTLLDEEDESKGGEQ